MLRLLVLVIVCILLVVTSEVCDDKYCLSTGEDANGLDAAKTKCGNSWLLEIYDENVITLLKILNVNNQQNNILLGMTKGDNSWLWSDGTVFVGNIYEQPDASDEVACITNNNNDIRYIAKKMSDYAGVICSKVTKKDNCAEWFYNGTCYFKPNSSNYCTWYEAHNECIKNQASMAIFNNYETNINKSFIDNQLYWVSLSRSTWNWTHPGAAANKVVTFNKWASGNPYRYPNDNNNIPRCATTNSDGREWKSVDCSGTFYIVCMRESDQSNPGSTSTSSSKTSITDNPSIRHQSTTQTLLINPESGNVTSEKTNEDPLSIGAKAGIGVGVSLFIIIIIIIGVLIFKYFHHFKKFGRKNSRKPLESENNHYAEVVHRTNTRTSIHPQSTIQYADLDMQPNSTSAVD